MLEMGGGSALDYRQVMCAEEQSSTQYFLIRALRGIKLTTYYRELRGNVRTAFFTHDKLQLDRPSFISAFAQSVWDYDT